MKDLGEREVSVERGSLHGHSAVLLFGVSSSVLLNEASLTIALSRHNSRVPLPSLEVLTRSPSFVPHLTNPAWYDTVSSHGHVGLLLRIRYPYPFVRHLML